MHACRSTLEDPTDGPFGSWFRYIGDTGTYVARYDELVDGWGEPIDVAGVAAAGDGVELEDREFLAAIGEGREPAASVVEVLPCYEVLARLERQLRGGR